MGLVKLCAGVPACEGSTAEDFTTPSIVALLGTPVASTGASTAEATLNFTQLLKQGAPILHAPTLDLPILASINVWDLINSTQDKIRPYVTAWVFMTRHGHLDRQQSNRQLPSPGAAGAENVASGVQACFWTITAVSMILHFKNGRSRWSKIPSGLPFQARTMPFIP